MDAIVEQALAKWPNVPHCYGWLALDARGGWRMRDEYAQTHHLPGDKIAHAALLAFINRNYTHDEQGRWYFQNGPQRVYVDLEAAPYIAHTEPTHGYILQTGECMNAITTAWLSEQGRLFLQNSEKIALLDDRDLAQCLLQLRLDNQVIADAQLMTWLEQQGKSGVLSLQDDNGNIPVNYIAEATISERLGFIRTPRGQV